jgi:putative oxidoreductase
MNWALAGRWLLAIVFAWAAVGKLANPLAFHDALHAYQLPLPPLVVRTIAVVLPWLELLVALLLAADFRRAAALLWAGALAAAFALATGQAWARGLDIACGCLDLRVFGLAPQGGLARAIESPAAACLRAVLLGAVAALLLRREQRAGCR